MFKKWTKRILLTLAVILLLITAIVLFLHTKRGRAIVKNKVEDYLQGKLGNEVYIGEIDYRLPKWIELQNVLIKDKYRDTLLSGKSFLVDIDMLKLISNDIEIDKIELRHITLNVKRMAADSNFNYQFIIDAFTTDKVDTTTKKKETHLAINNVLLDNVRFKFSDAKEKMYYDATLGYFRTEIQKSDLTNMEFVIKTVDLRNSGIIIIDSSEAKQLTALKVSATETEKKSGLLLKADSFLIKNLAVDYKSISGNLAYTNNITQLSVIKANFDAMQRKVLADKIQLDSSGFTIAKTKSEIKKEVQEDTTASADKPWTIRAASIALHDNAFKFDYNNRPPTKTAIDFNHLDLKGITLLSSKNSFDSAGIAANVDSMYVNVNDKFFVKDLETKAVFLKDFIVVDGFTLAANNSILRINGSAKIPLEFDKNQAAIKVTLDNSLIAYQDVLFWVPSLKSKMPIMLSPNDVVVLRGELDGDLRQLRVDNFLLAANSKKMEFIADATITNLNDPKRLGWDANIQRFHASKTLLSPAIQQKIKEKNVQIPDAVTLRGTTKGNMQRIVANLNLTTGYGDADIKGYVANISDTKRLQYDVTLTADKLQTGRWVSKDSLMGPLTGTVAVKGSGTDPKQMVANAKVMVKSFTFKGYAYADVDVVSSLNQGAYDVKGSINDPNLDVDLDLAGNIATEYPSAKGTVLLTKADLQKLGFSKDSLRIATTLTVDAPSLEPKNLDAMVTADSNTVVFGDRKIFMDSLQLTGKSSPDSSKVTVNAPFAAVSLDGKYNYEDLPKQVIAYIREHYLPSSETKPAKVEQQAKLSVVLSQHAVLKEFLPALTLTRPVTAIAFFDNRRADTVIAALINASDLTYNENRVQELALNASGADTALVVILNAKKVQTGEKGFNAPEVMVNLKDNIAQVDASIKDEGGKEFYALNAAVALKENETKIQLQEGVLLNYKRWEVAPNNTITIRKDGFIVRNFGISSNNQSIRINSVDTTTISPLRMQIDSFAISNILAIANKDSLIADGKLFADATVQQPIKGLPVFTGEAGIKGLVVRNVPIGDLDLTGSSSSEKIIALKGALTGANTIQINGQVNNSSQTIDINADIQKLDLKAVEAFSNGKIVRAAGNITGNMRLNGTTSEPKWNGVVKFAGAQFAYADFGSLYKIDNQQITFSYPEIQFNNFRISDTANHNLTVNGNVTQLPSKEFGLNLTANTRNFVAINAPRKADSYIYGVGIVDANLTIGGTSTAPDLQGSATLKNNSDIHYVVPNRNNYTQERMEVVKFVDIDTLKNFNAGRVYMIEDTIAGTKFKGLKYNLNLEVKEDAALTVHLDPTTDDNLSIKGVAQLNAGIDENGEMGLNGVYNLKSGTYNMTYQFLKRKFQLIDGSTITFSGDPKEAVADITAHYEVEASPNDLLGNEISESVNTLGTTYNQKIPFIVILKIKGSILKPDLSFDIKMKEGVAGVNSNLAGTIDNKLAQFRYDVAAMNKQVFALLIMNRFIGEQSRDFFGGSGFNPNTAARESVSRFLSEAINQIAEDLIKGVDIDLSLKDYETVDNTIARTDLSVALSKRLINDRLTVSVGKNFTVEGDDPVAKSQNNNNVQFIPDLTTTYKLSKDGRYMVRAYRRNQYEAIVDGYFIETGVVFSITMDYVKFKELFKKRKRGGNRRNNERKK